MRRGAPSAGGTQRGAPRVGETPAEGRRAWGRPEEGRRDPRTREPGHGRNPRDGEPSRGGDRGAGALRGGGGRGRGAERWGRVGRRRLIRGGEALEVLQPGRPAPAHPRRENRSPRPGQIGLRGAESRAVPPTGGSQVERWRLPARRPRLCPRLSVRCLNLRLG